MKLGKKKKNLYIQSLESQNKLSIATNLENTFQFNIGNKIIGEDLFIIAGPCSVESKEMIISISKELKVMGVNALRGGAFKPCTFPVKDSIRGWKEGLKEEGLKYLSMAKEESGLPIVSEIMDVNHLELCLDYIDVVQVGTRNFQNYALLDALGKIDKPVLLKRGTWGTIDEILGSVERILIGGNEKVVICLRGVVGMPSYRHVFPTIRWAPDLMMIPALKECTNIPIFFDPSHSTGYRNFVPSISRAAIAAGADGLIIEVHPKPTESISDPDQAITIQILSEIMKSTKSIYKIINSSY
jgi:3-deoxy-7-phosphoheptulonate synthase